jgi:chemotaxis protein methyltransferase CheR
MNSFTPRQFDGPTEYPYTPKDFAAISKLVHAHSGICLPDSKAMLVYSRLSKRLRENGVATFEDYVELISKDSAERSRAIESMTTNHTKFFREIHHFEHFEQYVRPELIKRLQSGGRVRLWSSASSSGEEPYSLAMTLLGSDRSEAQRICSSDVAMLATDLADHVLQAAEKGVYPANAAEDMPPRLAQLWTSVAGDRLTIAKQVRDLVRFRKLNLLNAWPIKGQFDVIFCRNVMIYFDEPTKELLLKRLCDQLAVGGYLYIGHSERLVGESADKFRGLGQTLYRKERA